MRDYRGPEGAISGAGSERDSRNDWEAFNFAPHDGKVYGYVASSGHRTIDVSKLGAHGDVAHGVLVVWVSVHPTERRQRLIGWYRNATVHRSLQQSPAPRKCTSASGKRVKYHVSADEADACLLPIIERTLTIPKGAGFMGQSNICFMTSPKAADLVDKILRTIDDHSRPARRTVPPEENHPDTIHTGVRYVEGSVRRVNVNAYERDSAARAECLSHWGVRCAVCAFNFEEVYGEIGRGFIHVHHLVPLASIRGAYELNPLRDLVPVCPNCHAMLHSSDPPLSIEELQAKIASRAPNKPLQRMKALRIRG